MCRPRLPQKPSNNSRRPAFPLRPNSNSAPNARAPSSACLALTGLAICPRILTSPSLNPLVLAYPKAPSDKAKPRLCKRSKPWRCLSRWLTLSHPRLMSARSQHPPRPTDSPCSTPKTASMWALPLTRQASPSKSPAWTRTRLKASWKPKAIASPCSPVSPVRRT